MHSEALPPARTGALMREAISMHSEALPPARTGAPDHRNASRAARRTATWPRHGRRRGRRGRWNERRRGHRGLWNGRRHGLLLLLLLMIRRCCDCVRELHWVHEGSRCRRQRRRRGVEGRARARARDRAELGLEIELISAHELARFSRSVIEKPLEIRPLLELALPDDCNQALSAAIRGNQRDPSTPRARAARCNQAPSAAPCEAVRGHQRSSEALTCQCASVESGATTKKGPRTCSCRRRWSRKASACAVFPKPISSASSTFRRVYQEKRSQLSPST